MRWQRINEPCFLQFKSSAFTSEHTCIFRLCLANTSGLFRSLFVFFWTLNLNCCFALRCQANQKEASGHLNGASARAHRKTASSWTLSMYRWQHQPHFANWRLQKNESRRTTRPSVQKQMHQLRPCQQRVKVWWTDFVSTCHMERKVLAQVMPSRLLISSMKSASCLRIPWQLWTVKSLDQRLFLMMFCVAWTQRWSWSLPSMQSNHSKQQMIPPRLV